MLWGLLLKRLIARGSLRVTDAKGKDHYYGNQGELPAAHIRLHDKRLHLNLLLNPGLHVGEAYMNGTLTVESGSTLRDVLTLFIMNLQLERPPAMRWIERLDRCLRAIQQYNPVSRTRGNVAHHYDLNEKLYESFLDKDMQYSCAYFTDEQESLEEAQYNKKKHIAAKLQITPGMRVLDIGCGFGGMALYLARELGAHVVGLTLSEEQLTRARERAREEGLERQVEFHLRDYRNETGEYDRIVSVGMFEHVGVLYYPDYFAKVKSLLKPDGIALIHSISRADGPGTTNQWLRKYIFPGGYSPAMSEVLPVIEQCGLWITDIEILRMHYALTIAEWYRRFEANRQKIASLYDERFCRMWEFYLLACELQFSHCDMMVFQMQITRDMKAVPFTRDYIFECERALSNTQKLPSPKRYAVH